MYFQLIIISILISARSLNLSEIILAQKKLWFFIPHFPMAVIFFIREKEKKIRQKVDC